MKNIVKPKNPLDRITRVPHRDHSQLAHNLLFSEKTVSVDHQKALSNIYLQSGGKLTEINHEFKKGLSGQETLTNKTSQIFQASIRSRTSKIGRIKGAILTAVGLGSIKHDSTLFSRANLLQRTVLRTLGLGSALKAVNLQNKAAKIPPKLPKEIEDDKVVVQEKPTPTSHKPTRTIEQILEDLTGKGKRPAIQEALGKAIQKKNIPEVLNCVNAMYAEKLAPPVPAMKNLIKVVLEAGEAKDLDPLLKIMNKNPELYARAKDDLLKPIHKKYPGKIPETDLEKILRRLNEANSQSERNRKFGDAKKLLDKALGENDIAKYREGIGIIQDLGYKIPDHVFQKLDTFLKTHGEQADINLLNTLKE